jgi:hypothetical protein
MCFGRLCLLLTVLGASHVCLAARAVGQELPSYGGISDLPAHSPPSQRLEDSSWVDASPPRDAGTWGESWRPVPKGHDLWPRHLRHGEPNDPNRHVGLGGPLTGTSWLNRPYYFGWLVGGLWGSTLIDGELDQDEDLFGGYRLGWDFDHYWGTEARIAFAHLDLFDGDGVDTLRTARHLYYDANLLFYPWGDAAWRPFASIGLGLGSFRFEDANAQFFDATMLTIPFGIGVKYYHRPWLALRTSLMDNFAVGGGLDTMHNFSWTAGVEVHFGGPRRGYFPYHPGGFIW